MEQRAILVVEDTAPIPNYQATAVVNGAGALAIVAEVHVDLFLVDANLPGLDGFAVHDLLRARPETASVPILFMTAGIHDEEFARRGVRGHINKPFDLGNLLMRAASALAGGGGGVGEGRVDLPGV